jgi:hypothetical protein
LLVAGIYLPLLWSSPHLCSAVPSCLLFNSYAKPCHASPHAAASGHALRVRRGGTCLLSRAPDVIFCAARTSASSPCSSPTRRQWRMHQTRAGCRLHAPRAGNVLRCLSSVDCRPLHVPRAGCLSASSCLRRRLPARSAIGWTARVPSASAPRLDSPPAMSAPGLGSALPHLHRHWAHPAHNCAGLGSPLPTSAPGLGSRLYAARPAGICASARTASLARFPCTDAAGDPVTINVGETPTKNSIVRLMRSYLADTAC